jgi:hypothetical protein
MQFIELLGVLYNPPAPGPSKHTIQLTAWFGKKTEEINN